MVFKVQSNGSNRVIEVQLIFDIININIKLIIIFLNEEYSRIRHKSRLRVSAVSFKLVSTRSVFSIALYYIFNLFVTMLFFKFK